MFLKAWVAGGKQKASGRKAFFFEKRSKKLLSVLASASPGRLSQDSQKFFGSFFQ
jgi:hypothetical protein